MIWRGMKFSRSRNSTNRSGVSDVISPVADIHADVFELPLFEAYENVIGPSKASERRADGEVQLSSDVCAEAAVETKINVASIEKNRV